MEFYTYLWLREDDSPYYVGKGTKRRAFSSSKGHRPPKDHSRVVLQYWIDEPTAFAYEMYLIDFWGRKDLDTGILRNLTDGGEGSSGCKASVTARENMSKAQTGRIKSEKHRKALSASLQGNTNGVGNKNFSAEERQRRSSRQKGNTYALGAVRTPETRKRLSASGKLGWIKRREAATAAKE